MSDDLNILEEIFKKQHELNARVLKEKEGKDYDELCDHAKQSKELDQDRVKWLLNYNRAQMHESIELEDSLPWKWWKEGDDIDWQNVGIELIDELHFWVSKCQIAGLSVDDIADLYMKKNKLNHHRQDKKYGSKEYQKHDKDGVEDNKRMDDILKED